MPVTATFSPPYPPDFNSQREIKPRVLKVDFGDGYAQRAGDGQNNMPITLNLTWTNLLSSEKDSIINFFKARKGYEAFFYTYADDTSAKVYVCEDWTWTHVDAGVYTVTATLQQVYDL